MHVRREQTQRSRGAVTVGIATLTLSVGASAVADTPINFGDPIAGLAPAELTLFTEGRDEFGEVETAADGLGPVFNNTSCAACHSSPAVGGDSNILVTRFARMEGKKFDPMPYAGGSLVQSD